MEKTEILDVVETDDGIAMLFIMYDETDIASAIGHVYSATGRSDEEARPTQLLATNDTLRVLWQSPAGKLWVASADGNVGTTAKVRWPAAGTGVDFKTLSGPKWTATSLPAQRSNGLFPNITALWGTSDDQVFAGTYDGDIYRWDGKAWSQDHDGSAAGNDSIEAFGGTGANDVYAVGPLGTLLHFDGHGWTPLRPPGPDNGNESLTGVHALPDGTVFISTAGDDGRLLHGSRAGFSEFGRYPIELIDMAPLDDRLLFATGDGVAELFGNDVRMIRDTFSTASISPGRGRVFFIEPAQEVPNYIVHDPRLGEDDAWWGMDY
ncbi:hypothetical protein [Piscinibacter gummiphilus]|uniref:Uncharacterized protein n=1 Tax=Piscinibacter gummiphilus TaxID=946333 RepID=A0A1W6L8V6_9BURK|nr:hypothetical protein [Piscinibacter gummiphilus]ARN20663.1 hypothetical protein A4W93_12580 [Piscinibacter gummiphilus]ATU65340.1 hypothetical protein CPZ87_12660 [Piscinibacter gummiphilus]GLS94484.1 hypothetical protein GCM10007918_17760 [Piscinibacter gummiphilus]